jgi:hypothetical protein
LIASYLEILDLDGSPSVASTINDDQVTQEYKSKAEEIESYQNTYLVTSQMPSNFASTCPLFFQDLQGHPYTRIQIYLIETYEIVIDVIVMKLITKSELGRENETTVLYTSSWYSENRIFPSHNRQ